MIRLMGDVSEDIAAKEEANKEVDSLKDSVEEEQSVREILLTNQEQDLLKRICEAEAVCASAEAEFVDRKEEAKKAKEKYEKAVVKLRKLAAEIANDSDRPIFRIANQMEEDAWGDEDVADSGITETGKFDDEVARIKREFDDEVARIQREESLEDSPAEKPSIKNWSDAPVSVLELPKGVVNRLTWDGITTVGKLKRHRDLIRSGNAVWPKGIGPIKIEILEAKLIGWLAQHDDGDDVDGQETSKQQEGAN